MKLTTFLGWLVIVLLAVALKVTGILNLAWWIILIPAWLPIVCIVALVIVILLVYIFKLIGSVVDDEIKK